MPPERLFEIQIGFYATEEDVTRLTGEWTQLLDSRAVPYQLSVAGQENSAPMPLAEFYADLPQQWRYGHPEADPGSRDIHQIRVGVLTPRPQMDTLRNELTRVICPDPDHNSPCAMPWASAFTDSEESPDAAEDLNRQYGHLR
ncbi:hypothetical protein [Saccharopolyspora spinosa]|uniref:Uncharacterized protein n=1 Tax=Saccharopolyspora spinosa TaxID=60894 RepID=A0A2N3XX56_SACSN|nr:hypothetical protein [Saccharopolyspora spinosa]PKW15220.1 hypothetical protein A8926_2910 [Saccharopolyspora spinosa]